MNSNKMIGIAATVIALASLILSVQQGYETRQHDRLMVKPCLLVINDYVDGDPEYGVLLSNKGIGPAFVRELKILVDGKRVTEDEEGGWKNARSQLGISEPRVHYSTVPVISAGETVPLMAIKREDQNDERKLRLREAIARLKIEVVYESGYGERFTEPPSEGGGS